jgi:beta-ureidopropionase / N-carbamoyl-L-amino-acid hydrolase
VKAVGPSIDGKRLWQSLMQMGRIGATLKGGVCRLALTDEDRQSRDLFIEWCRAAGCEIRIDRVGNIFARRAGTDRSRSAIVLGSHLDSQPTGGRFDGVYGVLAGLEVIRTLNDAGIATKAPIEVAVWTSEEGARFAPAMIGSGVFSGRLSLENILATRDRDGKSFAEELRRIGYVGSHSVGAPRPGAHVEVHIEQGPHLEAERTTIGVVTGVLGIRWYDVAARGEATHAGPTAMALRRDPVKAASALITRLYELADRYGPDARVTIGTLDAAPGSRNTVPHTVRFSLDIRHPDLEQLEQMDSAAMSLARAVSRGGVTVEIEPVWSSPPVRFDRRCVNAIRSAAAALGYSHRDMISGAGHDSVYLSYVAPTAMIFIPCAGGLSHNEDESASEEDVAAGANVLLYTCLELANSA